MAAFVRNKLMMMMMMIASNVIFLPLLQAANMEYTYWQIVVYVLKKLCGESLLELWLCKTFISIFTYFCICIVCILLCAANGVINDDDDDIVLRHLYYIQCYDTVGWVMWPVKSSPKWPIMCRVGC